MTDRSRKVLIRVIGAPLILAALGVILSLDHRGGSSAGLRWLVAIVALLSGYEIHAMGRNRGVESAWIAGLLALALRFGPGAALATMGKPGNLGLPYAFAVSGFLVLYVLLKLVFRHGSFTVEGAALTVLGYEYVSLLAGVFSSPAPERHQLFWILFLVGANKGSDMAAYVAGKSVGKHKMTRVLSPHKTWEGCVGGAIGGTVAAMAAMAYTPLRETYAGVPAAALWFFAFLVTMAAQAGDLVESAFKRWAGVKDSGRLIPEFGGTLDMVDSFLISVPLAHMGSGVLLHLFGGH